MTGKPAGGFVLIPALMGILILLAVGYFALTSSTGDMRIARQLIGERKAFSAAESGLQQFLMTFSPGDAGTGWVTFDPVNDPTAQYQIDAAGVHLAMPTAKAPGFGEEMQYSCYQTFMRGRDTQYRTQMEFDVTVKYGPVQTGFGYE